MSKSDIKLILARPDSLALEIKEFVSEDAKTIGFRADLAGLLVVSMAASYEACVKETLMSYAARHHAQFGNYAQNQFAKLNSRISMNELNGYARTFDSKVHRRFTELISHRKGRMKTKIGRDFTDAYAQILSWRHDFAHAGIRNTTISEALLTHRLAKRVLLAFDDAFK